MRDYKSVSKFLEIPREVISNVPKITITGFDELLIENFKGILEYEDFFVRISTSIGNVNINGFNLKLNQMTDDDIVVNGKIENIDFELQCGSA
jgi:sporulation protein YqfC